MYKHANVCVCLAKYREKWYFEMQTVTLSAWWIFIIIIFILNSFSWTLFNKHALLSHTQTLNLFSSWKIKSALMLSQGTDLGCGRAHVYTLLAVTWWGESSFEHALLSKQAYRVWVGMWSLWTSTEKARLKWNMRLPKWIDVKLGRPWMSDRKRKDLDLEKGDWMKPWGHLAHNILPVFHHVLWVNVQAWKGNRVVKICEANLITLDDIWVCP